MKLQITSNDAKNGIELDFSEPVPKGLEEHLKNLGFKASLSNPQQWYVDKHPAYKHYAIALQATLEADVDWKGLKIHPSFTPHIDHIAADKFSVVTIHYRDKDRDLQTDYVLFDSYKKVATAVATSYAVDNYGAKFKALEVFPRNYKRKARQLFENKKIIHSTSEVVTDRLKSKNITKEDSATSAQKSPETPKPVSLREVTVSVITALETLEADLEGEAETIIATTINDLEDALEQRRELPFKNYLHRAILVFKDWASDLEPDLRGIASAEMGKLTQLLDGTVIETNHRISDKPYVVKDIFNRGKTIANVRVPAQAGEPFQSGGLTIGDGNFLKFKFPQLYNIDDANLSKASAVALFQLSQMAHPKDFGIKVNRSRLLQEWESRDGKAFEALGFPTALDYPYVNIHTGYKSVYTLGSQIGLYDDKYQWWAAVEHSRPIADLEKAITIIDTLLLELVEQASVYINPKTKKPKTDRTSKAAFNDITWEQNRLEQSKQVIAAYQSKQNAAQVSKQTPKSTAKAKALPKAKESNDYIDKVIAILHSAYANAERLSKKKIEQLLTVTGAPTLGALWEAAELSWLLWYKMLYREPLSFEARLEKMMQFWRHVQPTYAYSDSSKELYKQYSTPGPISAIIAQYTEMDTAEFIFEPSAGNGLLLVGANPRITHVNEIDKSRRHSLKHQGFGRITAENAAEPFPELMRKVHDVVVTNPPFASWDAPKFDKQRIANTYFHKHRGLASHMRLEHLMAGFALYTMTDKGKAAIIIMGHVYYGQDGLFAKYRPFFNWLYRHYKVDDIINLNSYKLYNKQGAVAKTMLILIGGRKSAPKGVAPHQSAAPHLETVVETFADLWERVKAHIKPHIDTIIQQLKTAQNI